MNNQCVTIAKLVPLSGHESPKDKDIVDAIQRMGEVARSLVSSQGGIRRPQRRRLAQDIVRQDVVINRLNREVFTRAVEIGDDFELREWGVFMVLVAPCLERVGDNAVSGRRTDRIRRDGLDSGTDEGVTAHRLVSCA